MTERNAKDAMISLLGVVVVLMLGYIEYSRHQDNRIIAESFKSYVSLVQNYREQNDQLWNTRKYEELLTKMTDQLQLEQLRDSMKLLEGQSWIGDEIGEVLREAARIRAGKLKQD